MPSVAVRVQFLDLDSNRTRTRPVDVQFGTSMSDERITEAAENIVRTWRGAKDPRATEIYRDGAWKPVP